MVMYHRLIAAALSAVPLFVAAEGSSSGLLRGVKKERVLQTGDAADGALAEFYNGITGNYLDSLKNSAAFPDSPTSTSMLTDLLEIPQNAGYDYGTRITTFIKPKVTGMYTFWVASDDYGEVWLSTDENPENIRKIAYINGWTYSRQWKKNEATQRSDPIPLVKDTPYYFEGLHKEGGGSDNFAVAWAMDATDETIPQVITSEYFTMHAGALCASDADCLTSDWCTHATCSPDTGRCTPPADHSATQCPPLDAFCSSIRTCHSQGDGTTGYCQTVDICDDLNPCSQDTCDATTNSCSYSRINACDQQGFLFQTWEKVTGSNLDSLYALPAFPDSPDNTATITGVLEIPPNSAQEYGSRLTGYITAPKTGTFTFWVASDDQGEFYLSTDTSPDNIRKIAYVNGWTYSRQWKRNEATQRSVPIDLVLGESYYFEGRHKEGGGGDNFAVAWAIDATDETTPAIIQAEDISMYPPIACEQDADCTDNNYCTSNTCNLETYRCSVVDIDLSQTRCPPFPSFNEGLNVCKSNDDGTGYCEQEDLPFVFVGCYIDQDYEHFPDLSTRVGIGAGYDHYACHDACIDLGHKYFGLQANGICHCGDEYGRVGEAEYCGDCSIGSANFGVQKNCVFEDRCVLDSDCDDGDWCTENTCNTETGMCSSVDISATRCPALDDFCGSIQKCIPVDETTGTCETVPKCDDFNPCSTDTCDQTMKSCSHSRIKSCPYPEEGAFLDTWGGGDVAEFLIGSTLADLYVVPDFPDNPDYTETITGFLEAPELRGNAFGSRLRGYITAPATGEYLLYIASDDAGALFLSADTNPDNMEMIAYVEEHTGPRQWTRYPSQKSDPISLVVGETYYVEAHHKEGGGGDNLAIGWKLPGKIHTTIIDGSYFSKYPPIKGTNQIANAVLDGWTQVYAKGSLLEVYPDLWASSSPYTKQGAGRRNLNVVIQNDSPVFYVRRLCPSCAETHQDIVYKRLTALPEGVDIDIDYFDLFTENWKDHPYNSNLIDFTLHSSFEEALVDANPWSYCNYNADNVGFPRECGPSGWVGSQWNSVNKGGQPDIGLYVWNANPSITDPARPLPSVGEFGDKQAGTCVGADGKPQDLGVFKISNDYETIPKCLMMCAAYPGHTACEIISNQGCYVHTLEVARGSGEIGEHGCWVISDTSSV